METPPPWLRHYDDDVPASLAPYPSGTILDFVRTAAREKPDAAALLFKGRTVSWRELDRLSDAFGVALASLGVTKGARVAVLLPNCPQFVVAELGIWKCGGVLVALNPTYTEYELEQPIAGSGATILLTLNRFYARAKAVQPKTAVTRIITTNIKEFLPLVLGLLFTVFKEKKEGERITRAAGDLAMPDLLKAHAGQSPPEIALTGEDEAVILASGGTTGTPKGAVGRHRAYVMSGMQLHFWTRSLCRSGRDVIMLPLPLFHVYANVGVQAMAMVGQNPLALVPNPRDTRDVLDTIQKAKPAFFASVPTLFNALLNNPDVQAGKVDFASMKVSFSGAAALLAETKRRFEELTGGRIIEGYSLTEGMMACLVNPLKGMAKLGSIGVPLPDVAALIVDAETGDRELPRGEPGELLLHAPQLMDRYWQNPSETALVLRGGPDGRIWLYTGDLGYMDEDGYVFLVDRKKDLIKTGGFQVWPREIEEVIATHPAVLEVGVAGIPDMFKGEIVKAWVVLKPAAQAAEDEIRAYCRTRLAPYKVPSSVEFRQELPKTMVGKVLRRALAASEGGRREVP
jgi:long-chain acyl-CoA synthetase